MRTPLIAGNWKMNMTIADGVALVNDLKAALQGVEGAECAVCPPFTLLKPIADALAGGNIKLGAQDMFWEPKGAFTGQISGNMLKDVCCTYAIIGHSERRGRFGVVPEGWSDELLLAFGDNDTVVNKKVHEAFTYGLIPIMCCGETIDERERGITDEVVSNQIRLGLANLSNEQVASMVIAYEPVWAIGTGKVCDPAEGNRVIGIIRNTVREMFGAAADQIRIQYGGSASPKNIAEIMAQPEIDGALVGGAALKPTFADMIKAAAQK
ncbi:MAG TPA: triose-phosphate isomerase [Armatimonadota bacterium]|nr:triose-phosphate isomerase [Armatimonadota bacterium]